MSKKLRVVDLFSGCGGFSYGFESAGYHVVLGVDNDAPALATFKKNHNKSEVRQLDLHRDDAIDEIASCLGKSGADVIIAGPPCQGFSLTGTRRANDERNKLFYAVFKLAKKINPKAIIIENVPGLATLYGGKAKDEIIKRLDELGYTFNYQVLYAPDYGVPQIRKRIFFVGLKKELGVFNFPEKMLDPIKYVGTQDAIGDLPSLENDFGKEESRYQSKPKSEYQKLMRQDAEKLYNHVATNHTELVKFVISHVPEGGNYKNLPSGIGDSRKFNEAWTRYHSKKPSKTIDTGHRNHFHYKYNRIPTVRENARLQSFPDKFIFLGTRTQQNKQVGNAVPPLLGFHMAKQLEKYLKGKK